MWDSCNKALETMQPSLLTVLQEVWDLKQMILNLHQEICKGSKCPYIIDNSVHPKLDPEKLECPG